MAGHSKWKNIKHKKAAADAQKAKKFTKLLKEITVCAKVGGGDVQSNPQLRTLLEKANEINMPKDNYMRAIKRGTGEIAGNNYEPHLYEGYGPGSIAVLVEVLTDNKNRTAGEIRSVFQRNGGHLAELGSVSWMFERKGILDILVKESLTEDFLIENLLDYRIDTISWQDDSCQVICDLHDLQFVKNHLLTIGCKVEDAEAGFVSKNIISLQDEIEEQACEFLQAIDELDDVQSVYTNMA